MLLLFLFLLMSKSSLANNIESKHCRYINTIILFGANYLNNKEKEKLILDYQKRCLTLNDINDITKQITNYYIEKGYITTQAFISEQTLTNKTLTIQIIEGKINKIIIDDSSKILSAIIFPSYKEKVLNLRDLEQGLEQLNRLTTSQYTMEIQASDKVGYSSVFINKVHKKFPLNSQLTIDNSGSKSTGEIVLTSSTILDSLLGLGEQWSFLFNSNIDFSNSHHQRAYSASVNIPYGYWFYQYQISHHRSVHPLKSNYNSYPHKTSNTNQQIDIRRLVYRDKQQKIITGIALKYKKLKTQLAHQKLLISSPILTSFLFTPQYQLNFVNGYFIINPTAEIGLSLLGASPDYIADNSPRNHYKKLSINVIFQYRLPKDFIYLSSFYGQHTPDNLYSVEKISLGGLNSIRGYKTQSLNANKGFYWRNEINTPWLNSFVGKWKFSVAVDYGVANSDQYQTKQQTLLGSAVGASFSKSIFSSQVLINKPLFYPPSFSQPNRWTLSWSISIAI
ncbi:ShlB/FhaC/HecB family hemolysin secretion/activation protein [Proteus myxofaciens]|uniref:Channel-forming transporter/TpsB family cytolysins activator n=1 Tax=Proteus myxofaciens ATCC 19692 TaxID=1354337 RepID=A0A198FHN6_9GAMM|nr:ShlB/FhaC/HecB family hemolysin secretion/activation protein [Proteus myxofaciens]OAT24285.1 channel-forming transporter/TpsB family cytolysins activator [Proteus myxofaciens ATCC 19692]